ncbi:MAG: hypothetical protein L0Y76_07920 [Ignavibacteria bacterium]|nr:hypothetical protein [Ignavibacteria bacterium]
MIEKWKEFFRWKYSVIYVASTLIVLVAFLMLFAKFLIFVEARPGAVLPDPVFQWFDAVVLNPLIFTLIYGSMLTCFIYLMINYPVRLLMSLQTYSLLLLVRFVMMYVTPLDPPAGTIDLEDPLIFVVGTGTKITKDLFFSGHTSTMFMLAMLTVNKKLKTVFIINTFIVAAMVILQKVHYAIDVLVAPFVSYTVYRIIFLLNTKVIFKGKTI